MIYSWSIFEKYQFPNLPNISLTDTSSYGGTVLEPPISSIGSVLLLSRPSWKLWVSQLQPHWICGPQFGKRMERHMRVWLCFLPVLLMGWDVKNPRWLTGTNHWRVIIEMHLVFFFWFWFVILYPQFVLIWGCDMVPLTDLFGDSVHGTVKLIQWYEFTKLLERLPSCHWRLGHVRKTPFEGWDDEHIQDGIMFSQLLGKMIKVRGKKICIQKWFGKNGISKQVYGSFEKSSITNGFCGLLVVNQLAAVPKERNGDCCIMTRKLSMFHVGWKRVFMVGWCRSDCDGMVSNSCPAWIPTTSTCSSWVKGSHMCWKKQVCWCHASGTKCGFCLKNNNQIMSFCQCANWQHANYTFFKEGGEDCQTLASSQGMLNDGWKMDWEKQWSLF